MLRIFYFLSVWFRLVHFRGAAIKHIYMNYYKNNCKSRVFIVSLFRYEKVRY
ncbi:hypothetical protein KsCSTR_05030 [Candidatus Kuenenia stuttgartiensis]|jgi:hypothetical protein|uniref:Uncharacterized protein n=1 Tax=Kuenenia stuttgartiensis TaxID=174633 RepID=Q1Q084_KUEST|nr:hypothetical protein KsCSTR_05030 [Candidatus Kuenenia stuttgartiensis]CAJ72739.1 unknown protein [Candidatus Kuenenia stuttgartiensis]